MSMFKKFGTINYTLDGYSKDAMNILTAAIVKHLNVDQSYVYQAYIIPDGATPESIAHELYGDAEKYWTILLINGIVNPFLDWPMDQSTLEKWIVSQYTDPYKILYFTNTQTGKRCDDVKDAELRAILAGGGSIPAHIHPVTAMEHETNRNNLKSQITVIANQYINIFVDTFNRSIEGKA